MKYRSIIITVWVFLTPFVSASQDLTADELIGTGKSFYQVRELDSAYRYFNLAIMADSACDEAWFRRALVREKYRDNEGAIADYLKAASLNPKPVYHNNIGILHTVREDHQAALEQYNKALGIDSTYAQALFNKGIAYHHLGMTEEACRFVGKAREYGLEVAEEYLQQFCP